MTVWEYMSNLNGATAGIDEILNWMVMNKVCPLEVCDELNEGYQPELYSVANKHCDTKGTGACGSVCYREFLMLDMPEQEATDE